MNGEQFSVSQIDQPNQETGAWPFTVTTAGIHYVSIHPTASSSGVSCFEYLEKPDYMTTQYTFSVTQ